MLGGQELILIFLAVIFLFGASKIPEFARSEVAGEIRRTDTHKETKNISQNIKKLAADLRWDKSHRREGWNYKEKLVVRVRIKLFALLSQRDNGMGTVAPQIFVALI